MHIFKKSEIENIKKIQPKSMKAGMFFGTSILIGFWKIWGGLWKAKILDFRIFFNVFSMSFFECDSGGEKIDKKCEKTKLFRFLASGLRWS